jgi:hypothetical protein
VRSTADTTPQAGRSKPPRVIVCGSRRWHDRQRIADRLGDLPPDSTIVHGGAKGADRIAHQEAQKWGLLVEEHDYRPFITRDRVSAKRAPLVRNEHMAALGADLCIAFWDGRSTGTGHMIERAQAYGIPVEIVSK